MKTPTRVQRSRAKGSRLPPNTKCCTRPGFFSNPLVGNDAAVVYYKWLTKWKNMTTDEVCLAANVSGFNVGLHPKLKPVWFNRTGQEILNRLPELREYDHVACFCSLLKPCHVDTQIQILKEM